MNSVDKIAHIDLDKCDRCVTCVRVCPVEAIALEKTEGAAAPAVDDQRCLACAICATRCPEQAISMIERAEPLYFGVDPSQADQAEIERICRAAHMYPDQIICYCRRTSAREVAAAILMGHRTPEAVSRATGVRSGCGVLCITSVLRLLKAAGVQLEKAPGYQWYGKYLTIWDLSPEILKKYPEYCLEEDLTAMNQVFPKGE